MSAHVRALRAFVLGALMLGWACRPSGPAEEDLAHPRELGLPASEFVRPDPTPLQHAFENGLMAYVVEDHSVPLVTVAAVVGAGFASDSRQGSAEALVNVLRNRGPATRSSGDFRASLDRMVADFRVTQTPEETTIELEVPAEDWIEAVGLLADLLMSPAVSDAEVRSAMSTLASANAGSRGVGRGGAYEGSLDAAVALMEAHVFSGHPFGRAPTPVEARTLNAVAVRAFHQDFFVPDNTVVTVAGAVESTAARSVLDEAFSEWLGAPVPASVDFPTVASDDRREVLAYPADKLQAWIVLGHDLPVVPMEDEASLQVMNYVIGGGHFDTRLFRATRDRRGLTNDDSGFLSPGIRGPGTYTFRTYGRPEVVKLLLHLTLLEIDRIRAEPLTDEELFVAKGALADGEFTLGFRNGRSTALTLAREWLRFGNHERTGSYQARVRSVTAEAVLEVAQRYLRPTQMDLVVLGPLEKVQSAPSLEGESPIEAFGELIRH